MESLESFKRTAERRKDFELAENLDNADGKTPLNSVVSLAGHGKNDKRPVVLLHICKS